MILIDTHILLWSFEGMAGHMGRKTQTLVKEELGDHYVSMASFMEIRVKQRKGGLKPFSIMELAEKAMADGANILGIQLPHIILMPGPQEIKHADPFDLLLIGQAVAEKVPLLTCDAEILRTKVPGLKLIDGRL